MLCQSAFGPLNPSYIDLTTRQVNPVFQSKEGVTLIQWFCFTFLEQILLLWKFVFDSLGRQAGPTASTLTCSYQFLLQEKGTRLDQLCSLNFIYFIIFDIDRFITINCKEVISSNKFILYKYILRSSLNINITYNNFVVRDLFLKSVLGSIIEVRYNSETNEFLNSQSQ